MATYSFATKDWKQIEHYEHLEMIAGVTYTLSGSLAFGYFFLQQQI